MPTWRLIFDEDFSSYANEAALDAAYPSPHHYPDTTADWGLNIGPDGQAGIKDQAVGFTSDSGIIKRAGFNPPCRGFRVSGRWNFAATNAILTIHEFISIDDETETFNSLVFIGRVHASETLRVVIRTTAPYSTSGPPYLNTTDVAGILDTNVPATFEIQGERSTITETSPGVFTPAADGWVKTYLNGIERTSFTGVVWNGDSSANPTPYWNSVRIQTIGAFSDWLIYDNTDCTVTIPGGPTNNSNPDCCQTAPPGGTTAGPVLPPTEFNLIAACAGGGQAPDTTPITNSENWAV